MGRVGVGAVPSHAVCVWHKGAWLKRHMEAHAFLAWPPFTYAELHGGLPRGMGYFITRSLRNLLTLEAFKAVDV